MRCPATGADCITCETICKVFWARRNDVCAETIAWAQEQAAEIAANPKPATRPYSEFRNDILKKMAEN